MFRPLSLYIGLRYTRAKRRQHFISFISLASMLGIALGVAVLITVLSVMNGFDYEIQNRLFNITNHVTISPIDGQLTNWPKLAKEVTAQPKVKAAAPFVRGEGVLSHQDISSPVLVTGILPDKEQYVSEMASYLQVGSFNSLVPQKFNIIIGEGIANDLGLTMGDKVILFTPQVTASPLGIIPRFKQFTVSGIFHVDGSVNMDRGMAFVHLKDAQILYQKPNSVSGLRLKVSDIYAAPGVSAKLAEILSSNYIITNWTQEYGTFFKAMEMEKTMIFLILVLIIAVAAFNLVSSLVMVVNDKRADIAILRTFGAPPSTIMASFIVQGCVVGFVGTFLGLIGGVLLALNATQAVNFIQHIFHVELISSFVYFVNYLPSRLEWSDVWQICSIALGLSLLATIYPAWQASKTQPAEALRYE